MITVAIFNIFAVFFAFLAGCRRDKLWLKASFIVIFLFLALRYDFGNDYNEYLQGYLNINQTHTSGLVDQYGDFELGWLILCRFFEPVGFFAMVAVLALFNCVVYYHFIQKYVPPAYYWLAVFIYVFDPDCMLLSADAMRQLVAINLFIISIDYIYRKDALRYFLCISIAALFHTSALILIPVFLLGLYNWKINNLTAIGIFLLFLLMYAFGGFFPYLLQQLADIVSILGRYNVYGYDSGVMRTGLGVIFFSCLFALVLFYARSQTGERSLFFKIYSIDYFLLALCLFALGLGRVRYYFGPAGIVVFPLIAVSEKRSYFKYVLLAMLIFMTLYSFIGFFNNETFKVAFGVYHTIFSSSEYY